MTEGRTISQAEAERPTSKQRDGGVVLLLLPGVRQAMMAVVRGPKTPRIEAICSEAGGGVEGGFSAPDSDDGADGPVGGDDGAAVEGVEGDGVDFFGAGAGGLGFVGAGRDFLRVLFAAGGHCRWAGGEGFPDDVFGLDVDV